MFKHLLGSVNHEHSMTTTSIMQHACNVLDLSSFRDGKKSRVPPGMTRNLKVEISALGLVGIKMVKPNLLFEDYRITNQET